MLLKHHWLRRDEYTFSGPFNLTLIDDINPEDAGMIAALKARSTAPSADVITEKLYAPRRAAMREALMNWHNVAEDDYHLSDVLDELMAIGSHSDASALARRIHKDYTVGYGHKSIADCATGVLIVVEGVTILAANALENTPLFSGVETSTRAVDIQRQPLWDPLRTTASSHVLSRWLEFYAAHQKVVADDVRRRYPLRQLDESEDAYERAVKYRVFDIMRGWIPTAVTTHVAIVLNLRQWGDHLTTLLVHPLAEVRTIAQAIQALLRERYPNSGSFGNAAAVSGVGLDGREAERTAWNARMGACTWSGTGYQGSSRMFQHYDDTLNWDALLHSLGGDSITKLATRPRGCVFPHWMADLGQISCGFMLDFGGRRDLDRHRNGVSRRAPLTTDHGFHGWYLDQLPEALHDEAIKLLEQQEEAVAVLTDDEVLRQYYLPLGYNVPVYLTYGLPAFTYVVEQRSGAEVHPAVRQAVLNNMVAPFEKRHPEIRLNIDRRPDPWSVRRGQQTITEKR